MFGFPQQHNNNNNNNNGGSSSLSDEAEWTQFYDLPKWENVHAPWQTLDELWVNAATQVPPMLPAEATQHHHTLPHHVNQIESAPAPAPVELPSRPVEALVHNGGSTVQNGGGSSVRRKRGRGKAWSIEEHSSFLHGLRIYGKGDWKSISRYAVQTRTSTQVASHAQKYFLRQNASPEKRKRKSIHDITLEDTNVVPHHIEPQNSTPHPDPAIQQVHEMQQMLPLNPPNSMTHQMSEFDYFDNNFGRESLLEAALRSSNS